MGRGEKREQLERLLRDRLSSSASEHPLSYNQRSIWFMHRLAPDSPAYNVPYLFRIAPPFDVDALRGAFRGLIGRHAILRTTYSAREPVQRVGPPVEPDFLVVDASAWSDEDLWTAVGDEAHRPFDLVKGPVLRVRVYVGASGPAHVLVTFHHIAYDLWSMMTMLNELAALYRAEQTGAAAALPPNPRQYSDFVRWQSTMLAVEGPRLWAYWQEQLSGALPVLRLPVDRERPAVQSFDGDIYRWPVPETLVKGVQALARAERTTIFCVLLSAFQLLLHRLSGQPDILVGTPVAGRTRAEFEDVIGYLLNTLPLRSHVDRDVTFRTFLGQTRQVVHGALEHQDYPVELLAQQVRMARRADSTAFFQAVFVLNRPHRLEGTDGSDRQSLAMESIPLDLHISPFDLSLEIHQRDDSLVATWEYNTDLFDASTIARWAGHFEQLLEAVVEDPGCPVSALSLGAAGVPAGAGADRQALPPRTVVEEAVSAVYCEVLGLDRLSVDQSFFSLGGDSFKAAQVASRLAALAGPEITLRTVFECETVERLAVRVEQVLLAPADDPAAPASPARDDASPAGR